MNVTVMPLNRILANLKMNEAPKMAKKKFELFAKKILSRFRRK